MLRRLICRGFDTRRIYLVFACLILAIAPGAGALSVHAAEPLRAQTPTEVSRAGTLIGRTNAAQTMTLAVPLKPHNQTALDDFLAHLYDPTSPTYHHYLTPQHYTQRFFDPADRAQVDDYLQKQGFTVSDPGVGAVIDATGSAAQAERAFNVTIADYRDASGVVYFANDVTPAVPQSIAARIDGILGLDSAEAGKHAGFLAPPEPPRASVTPNSGTGCSAATTFAASHATYLPNQYATAYNLDALHTAGFHGENQTIALFEASDYHDTDPAAFQSCFNTAVPLTRVLVDGGPTGSNQYSDIGEVDGDIETLVGQATHLANVLVYETPNTDQGYIDAYAKIANDNLASAVSTSWYQCEPYLSTARKNAENTAFQQMAIQGQSIFAAAGDYGSTSCLQFTPTTHKHDLSLDDPSSQPYVTGVGGTTLTINSTTNAYVSERVWNNYPNTPGTPVAGGGGLSILWSQPAYQTGPGTTGPYDNGMRQVPDVTADGDYQWTFYIGGSWVKGVGTSVAAPLWAAGIVLVNQYDISHGGTRIGFANPALYALLNNKALWATAFHDITVGDNCVDPSSTCGTPNNPSGKYPATPYYDLASGIGSPNFGNLALVLLPPNALPTPRPTVAPIAGARPLPAARPPGVPIVPSPHPLPSLRPQQ
ncbi:MAG: protease pro-enzyme activation domain-containing protein [Chloroflexota bacterium]|nr:protease pro-enzyme activation domain-containing protein [Chloroflexota bacterium]